jgi:hypothetical protein
MVDSTRREFIGGTAVADPDVPDDLMSLMDVLEEFKPRRGWWDERMAKGEIARYRIPGVRGIYLSRADVVRLTAPQRIGLPRKDEEPTS